MSITDRLDFTVKQQTITSPLNVEVSAHHISMFEAVPTTVKGLYGGSKNITLYNIQPAKSRELIQACHQLVSSIEKDLDGYQIIMLSKSCEVWTKEGETSINNVFFKVSINHQTQKVFVTPIMNNVAHPEEITFKLKPKPEEEEFQ